jgi:hypothetical protein
MYASPKQTPRPVKIHNLQYIVSAGSHSSPRTVFYHRRVAYGESEPILTELGPGQSKHCIKQMTALRPVTLDCKVVFVM